MALPGPGGEPAVEAAWFPTPQEKAAATVQESAEPLSRHSLGTRGSAIVMEDPGSRSQKNNNSRVPAWL